MSQVPVWLDVIAKLMQFVTGVAAIFIAIVVYIHNKKSNKESIRERAWQAQQQLNYLSLRDINVLKAADFTIEGMIDHNFTDDDIRRAVYTTFIQLNRIHLLWNGWNSNIFTEQELYKEIQPTLRLIIGNKDVSNYCLTRGYEEEFVNFVNTQMSHVDKKIQKPLNMDQFIDNLRKGK